ncbi:RraA family protein [Cedecea davisae]|nr:RraA family protein [Cedecea davisae]
MMNKTLNNIRQRLLALDTAAVSDALDSIYIAGGIQGIKPQVAGRKIAGPAFTVQYEAHEPEKNTFMNAGTYIDEVPEGAIIVVDNQGREDCTSWGNILTTKALQKNIAGTVIHGSARDVADIRKMNYPLFAANIFMVSGKNRARVRAVQCSLEINGVKIEPGDWIMGDDNGVVAIPRDRLMEVVLLAENVAKTEHQILSSISEGTKLADARRSLGYAAPWGLKG